MRVPKKYSKMTIDPDKLAFDKTSLPEQSAQITLGNAGQATSNALPLLGLPSVGDHAVSPTEPSALLKAAFLAGQNMVKMSMVECLQDWVNGSQTPLIGPDPEEITWFISKRAHALIDEWLMNKKLAVLAPLSPTGTGCVVISRDRVEHVRDSRTTKDSVTLLGVVELLGRLFAHGSPKYAPNPGYPNQLLMFDTTYKAVDQAAHGESPVAALQFCLAPVAHFRLETAYWMKPAKAKALDTGALKKKGK